MKRSSLVATGIAISVLATPVALVPTAAADPVQATASGGGGAAATVDATATRAATAALRRGGNAIDAAVVAASVLGVTEPFSCGIGGGGYAVIRDGRTGKVTTIDSREKAPAAVQPNSFFIDGRPPSTATADFNVNRYSGLSVGVPGTPSAWDYMLRTWGTFSLAQAVGYGARVADRGFAIDSTFNGQVAGNAGYFDDLPATASLYLDAAGKAKAVGETQRNPDLAKAYRRIGRLGVKRGFYTGAIADAIVKATRTVPVGPGADHAWRPGLMTAADLARYRAVRRDPVRIAFRGVDVYGVPPSTSGGTTVEEALNIMESFANSSGGSFGATRAQVLHRYLEASRLAYADRNAFLADPSFTKNPVAGLTSQAYADQRASLITNTAAKSPVAAGNPAPFDDATAKPSVSITRDDGSTTHLTVADAKGNMVAYTFTIEQIGGAGIVVPGWGFLLNNELTDFNTDSTTQPNRAEGGKRPRSSIAPMIVTRGGKPFLAVGSPGGATIITTSLQVLVNRLVFHDTLPQAIAAPRASQRNSATGEAEAAFQASPVGRELTQVYGQRFSTPSGNGELGAATGVEYRPGGRLVAAAEPTRRGGGYAAVVRPSK